MKFDKPDDVEQVCFQMKMADYPRSLNRSRIDYLFNGGPPFSEEERQKNGRTVNFNDLSGTRLAHEARSQMYSGFLKPGNYFTAVTDTGAKHKRQEYSKIVTREVNKLMKRSLPYIECFRSKFALDVLHGIAPAGFRDGQRTVDGKERQVIHRQ